MDVIGWGVMGAARIAEIAVIPALQRARNARVVAIASRTLPRAQDAARRMGIAKAYGSYEALLDDPEVQAVYIPLPNALHREWTLRSASAGKHVLCEKPLAVSAEDCEAMIAACRRQGVTLMEAFMYRFHPRTERALEIAASGAIGEVRLVRAEFTFAARTPHGNIRFDPALGGGALFDVGCYAVNLCRAVLGEPREAMAFASTGSTGVDEVTGGLLRFDDRRLAVLDCALTLPRRQEYEIVGTDGTLRVPAPDAFLPGTADAELYVTRTGESQVIRFSGTDQYQRMVEHFGDALAGRPLALPPEDAVGNLRVLAALHASIRRGAPVSIA